ncbi:MAG: InlB B-repeat-containing protein [Clostridiales bacterium]|nr:InlB B-repeat-containing protein [Clostridiales bacterium]
MRKKQFRWISILLSVFLVVSMIPTVVFAGNDDAIEIVNQPEDVTAAIGEEKILSVEANNVATYQWQRSADGQAWSNISTTNVNYSNVKTGSLTVKVNKNTVTFVYRCTLKNNAGTIYTDPASVTLLQQLEITAQPQNIAGGAGEEKTMSVLAPAATSYQWQRSANGGETWSNIGTTNTNYKDVKTNILTIRVSNNTAGYVYRCVVKNTDATVNSDAASVRVIVPVEITGQPEDIVGAVGEELTMSVAANNAESYQWQRSADGQTWSNISATNVNYKDVKTETLTIKLSKNTAGYVYRCVVKNSDSTEYSDFATVGLTQDVKVTFDAGEGAFESGESTNEVMAPYGYFYLDDMEEPAREGYGFLCWKLNGKRVTRVYLNSDVTLEAEWVRLYNVTFNANGGEFGPGEDTLVNQYPSGTVNVDNIVPERAGYDFDGWTLNGSRVKKLRLTGDVELVAQWVEVITVTYDANGGFWQFEDEPSFTTVDTYHEAGKYYIGWHEPMHKDEDYAFLGWTVNGEFVEYVNLTEPITVKAEWAKKYQLTFDPNGGSWDGDTVPRIDEVWAGPGYINYWYPERDGFEFVGWNTSKTATTGEKRFSYDIESDVTFYAIWKASGDVVVTYEANGGIWDDGRTTEVHYCNAGDYYSVGVYTPKREGYDFDGWLDENDQNVDGVEFILEANKTYTYRANWVKAYLVTYDATEGVFDGFDANNNETNKIHYRTARAGEYYWDGWEPEREDYRFGGWSLDGITPLENPLTISADTTLYALWNKIVNVTYVTDVGMWVDEWDPEGNYPVITKTTFTDYDVDEYYRISGWWPDAPEEYILLGYTTEEGSKDVVYELDEEIGRLDDSITLYAVWEKRPVITYDAAGGVWGDEEYTEEIRTDVQEIGRKYYVGFDEPWRDGYEFDGWVDKDGASADRRFLDLQEGDEYTFYATWVKIGKIFYYSNDGAWDDERTVQDHTCRVGEYYYVGCWEPEREGYRFDGWVDENGDPADGRELCIEEDGVYEFFASWVPAFKVTYLANGGEWDDFQPENGETSEMHIRMERADEFYPDGWHPDREGYWFIGWSLDGVEAIEGPMELDNEITLVALWKKQISITYVTDISYWRTNENGQEVFYTVLERENCDREDQVDGWWPEPVEGYNFLGYTTIEDSKVPEYQPNDPLVTGEEDIIFYAIWEHVPVIRYHANGGAWGEGEGAETMQVDIQNIGRHYYVRHEFPHYEGYEFAGWVDENNNPVDNLMIELQEGDEFDFYATWKLSVKVTYDANGGYWGDEEHPQYIDVKEESSGPYNVGNWYPERPGYIAYGWSTDPEAEYGSDGWLIDNLTEDITLYMIWKKAHTLTLDAGEGAYFEESGSRYTSEMQRDGQTVGTDLDQLPTPIRQGYRFVGWAMNGEMVARRYRMTSDVTFTAVWEKICTIILDANGGNFSNGEELFFDTCDEGDFIVPQFFEEPVREGYVFDGWVNEQGEDILQMVVDDDVKLIAMWVEE